MENIQVKKSAVPGGLPEVFMTCTEEQLYALGMGATLLHVDVTRGDGTVCRFNFSVHHNQKARSLVKGTVRAIRKNTDSEASVTIPFTNLG
jgi:glutamine synthetase type III